MKNCDIFLIFALNIGRGYTVLMRTHILCFRVKIRKMNTPVNFSLKIKKNGVQECIDNTVVLS